MTGGGGGIIIIKRLLEDCSSRLTAEQKDDLLAIQSKGDIILPRMDALTVARIAYAMCRRP